MVSINTGKGTVGVRDPLDIGQVKGKNTGADRHGHPQAGPDIVGPTAPSPRSTRPVSIDYSNGLSAHALKNQIRLEVDTAHSTGVGPPHSGSVVVDANNKVIGLLYADHRPRRTVSFANPIQSVLDELRTWTSASHWSRS